MTYLQRAAVLTDLVRRLRQQDSWAGATHVQKAAYLLQEMLGVPLGLGFRLYKYGPFSSVLRDELDEMEVDGFIEVEAQRPPYGPRLSRGEAAETLERHYGNDVKEYRDQLEFVVDNLAGLGVGELEKLTTAFFVTAEADGGVDERAARLHEIKPHVSPADAEEAVRRIDEVVAAAACLGTSA